MFVKKILQMASVFAVVLMVSCMLIGVFSRYVLDNSVAWAEEIALLAFVWTTFLTAAAAIEDDSHVRINALTDLFPGPVRKVLELAIWAMAALIGAHMVYTGLEYVIFTFGQKSPAVRYPSWLRDINVPIFGLLTVVFSIKRIKSIVC